MEKEGRGKDKRSRKMREGRTEGNGLWEDEQRKNHVQRRKNKVLKIIEFSFLLSIQQELQQ